MHIDVDRSGGGWVPIIAGIVVVVGIAVIIVRIRVSIVNVDVVAVVPWVRDIYSF